MPTRSGKDPGNFRILLKTAVGRNTKKLETEIKGKEKKKIELAR